MKKGFAIFMALTMLLTLTACAGKAEQADPSESAKQETTKQETPAEPAPELAEVPQLRISGEKMDGRLPGGEYVLPEEVISMRDWQGSGAVGLLAEAGEAAFYALEGKESHCALLRWGDSQGEFDWWYSTSRAIEPKLWVYDIDSDGEDEVVADCYGGSGTGVSMEYFYVVEKNGDGSLTSYELPWASLAQTLNDQLQTISMNGAVYAALGRELVDISAELEGVNTEDLTIRLGQVAAYRPVEGGLACSLGVVAEGSEIPFLTLYVATVEGVIRYVDGNFTLEELHLLS